MGVVIFRICTNDRVWLSGKVVHMIGCSYLARWYN